MRPAEGVRRADRVTAQVSVLIGEVEVGFKVAGPAGADDASADVLEGGSRRVVGGPVSPVGAARRQAVHQDTSGLVTADYS
jgi:hypothetical protein